MIRSCLEQLDRLESFLIYSSTWRRGELPLVLWDNVRCLNAEPSQPEMKVAQSSTVAIVDAGLEQDAKPLGNGDEFGERLHLHLFHDAVTMSLDGAFRRA